MTAYQIFVQAVCFLGTALYFISFQCKNNRVLFRVQFVSYLCYTVHFFLLGAFTGAVCYILNAVRSYALSSGKEFLRGKKMCVILCLLQILVPVFTWNGWITVLPVVANIASTIGGYTHNARKIRSSTMFVNSPLWIVYDILVGSWAGVLDETITELSIIISILRYGWKNLDQTDK